MLKIFLLSFPRKRESMSLSNFLDSRFRGNDRRCAISTDFGFFSLTTSLFIDIICLGIVRHMILSQPQVYVRRNNGKSNHWPRVAEITAPWVCELAYCLVDKGILSGFAVIRRLVSGNSAVPGRRTCNNQSHLIRVAMPVFYFLTEF
jgi:hypothetical protein